ncbi:MAG: GxxExxY protein [Lacipirellulaceae bacterium]
MQDEQLTSEVIGCAMEVHRALGPGLLESTYEKCLLFELREKRINAEAQVALPIKYKGESLDAGYRIDLLVEDKVIVELKSIDSLLPIHEAQLLSYLKLSGLHTGLLINFNTKLLKEGIKRMVNG